MRGWRFWLAVWLWPSLAGAWSLAGSNIGGWPSGKVTIYYNAASCPISQDLLVALIDQAVSVWNAVPTSGLTLERGSAVSETVQDYLAGKATLTPLVACDINFKNDNDADPDLVPAATRVTADGNGNVSSAAVILNAQLGTFAEFSMLSTAEQSVAISHEMGHALGLGHSSSSQALMYYSIGDKSSPILTRDDMDGIAYLYPRSEFSAGPFGCGAVHGTRAPVSMGFVWVFLAGIYGIGRLLVLREAARAKSNNQT